jgi:hypothetical protein
LAWRSSAAVTPVDKLLVAMPELGKVAEVSGEQISPQCNNVAYDSGVAASVCAPHQGYP